MPRRDSTRRSFPAVLARGGCLARPPIHAPGGVVVAYDGYGARRSDPVMESTDFGCHDDPVGRWADRPAVRCILVQRERSTSSASRRRSATTAVRRGCRCGAHGTSRTSQLNVWGNTYETLLQDLRSALNVLYVYCRGAGSPSPSRCLRRSASRPLKILSFQRTRQAKRRFHIK